MARASNLKMLLRALARRCPNCGSRGIFASYTELRESCPTCGLRLHRGEDDYFIGAYLLNLIAVLGVAFVVVSLAAAALPWTRPGLVASGPALGGRRWVGLPGITIVGVISAGAWAFVVWTAFHTGFGGTLSWKPMIQAFVPTMIAIVWYLVAVALRRSQGISLARTFQEIPPE